MPWVRFPRGVDFLLLPVECVVHCARREGGWSHHARGVEKVGLYHAGHVVSLGFEERGPVVIDWLYHIIVQITRRIPVILGHMSWNTICR